MIEELSKCQKAKHGYLSAFPTEHFERLRNLQAVWAPFYVVIHYLKSLPHVRSPQQDSDLHYLCFEGAAKAESRTARLLCLKIFQRLSTLREFQCMPALLLPFCIKSTKMHIELSVLFVVSWRGALYPNPNPPSIRTQRFTCALPPLLSM